MSDTQRLRSAAAIGATAVCALLATACSGSSDSATLAADESGTTPVRVTTLGLCNEAIAWGVDQGIFTEHGLDVELVNVQSGAAGIAALQSGETDIAYVNTLSTMQAVEQGVPLRVVSGSGLSTERSNGVVVAANSPYNSPKDLQGQDIAINQLGGLGQIVTEAWIAADAGAPSTARFVTLPFADQVPAVVSGNVAGAQVTATQVRAGEEAGTVRDLGNPFYDGIGQIETAIYVTTQPVLESSRDTLAKFTEAMTATAESANDEANDEARFAVMAASCKSTPETVAATPEPDFRGAIDMERFEAVVTLLEDNGQVTDVDLDELVPDFARGN